MERLNYDILILFGLQRECRFHWVTDNLIKFLHDKKISAISC